MRTLSSTVLTLAIVSLAFVTAQKLQAG